MIRQIIQKFIIAISVIFITAFGAHANTDKCLQALANDLATNLQEHVDSDNDVVIISSDGLVEFLQKILMFAVIIYWPEPVPTKTFPSANLIYLLKSTGII